MSIREDGDQEDDDIHYIQFNNENTKDTHVKRKEKLATLSIL